MKTTVVNLRFQPHDVYIGRAGNGKDGYFGNPFPLNDESERVLVLQKYEAYFYERLERDPTFKTRIHELQGKKLGCFCKPKLCHGDIIADYLNHLH
jgi:hypothetical protein